MILKARGRVSIKHCTCKSCSRCEAGLSRIGELLSSAGFFSPATGVSRGKWWIFPIYFRPDGSLSEKKMATVLLEMRPGQSEARIRLSKAATVTLTLH